MIKSAELENSAYEFEAKMPLRHAVPLGLQHVFAMFVGNLTPLLIITSACGLAGGEFADLQVSLLQNAMFVAGIVTLVQLYGLGPVGGKVPIIMGTSSGFLGVFNSVAATMGGDVTAYGAMMGASILGGLFESVLGVFLKPLRKLFPPVVTGTVVLSIGLSLISVGVNSFGGGNAAKDFGSAENLLLAVFVLVVILFFKHWTTGFLSSSSILIGIVAGYLAAFIMGFVLPTTGVTAEGVEFTKAWVLNWSKVAQADWFAIPKLVPVKIGNLDACDGDRSYQIITQQWEFGGMDNPKTYLSEADRRTATHVRSAINFASRALMLDGDTARARELLNLSVEKMPANRFEPNYYVIETIKLLYAAADPQTADSLARYEFDQLEKDLVYFYSFPNRLRMNVYSDARMDLMLYNLLLSYVEKNNPDLFAEKKEYYEKLTGAFVSLYPFVIRKE